MMSKVSESGIDVGNASGLQPLAPTRTRVVVFDLGGVVVRIWHAWQDVIRAIGMQSPLLDAPPMSLGEFGGFERYQADEIEYCEYLEELAGFLGCTLFEADQAHQGILREPYPGMADLIDTLIARQIPTGCLSNTNAPHWRLLTTSQRYSLIGRLGMRMGSHEIGCAKPNPDAFEAFTRRFELDPTDIVYFDDNQINVFAARSLGWDAHAVDPEGDPASLISSVLRERGLLD